jgi:thioredoxin 1
MAVIHANNENFKKEVLESKIPVIVDFWAPWCGPCQMMGPVFESLSNKYKDKLKFVKVNTDEYSELATNFKIQGIPALVVVNKGKEVNRMVGFVPEPHLKKNIDNILESL